MTEFPIHTSMGMRVGQLDPRKEKADLITFLKTIDIMSKNGVESMHLEQISRNVYCRYERGNGSQLATSRSTDTNENQRPNCKLPVTADKISKSRTQLSQGLFHGI